MRIQVAREAMGNPLPAYAEEQAGAGPAFRESEDGGHCITKDEMVLGEVMKGATYFFECTKACACFEYALGLKSFPSF